MTFQSLSLVIILGHIACLETFHAFTTTAAYGTFTNTIDAMGALKPTQENITEGYRGQNVYHGEKEDSVISKPRISERNHSPESPDVPIVPETLRLGRLHQSAPSSSVLGTSKIVMGGEGPSLISYVGVNSGPSIRISSGSGVGTISYYGPGGVLISHGSPGASYVLSAYSPASYFYSSGKVFENHQMPQSTSSSVSPDPADHVDRPVPIHDSEYIRGPDPYPIINLVRKGPFPSVLVTGGDGNAARHSAHVVAYRNLQEAREIVARASTAVSQALDYWTLIGV